MPVNFIANGSVTDFVGGTDKSLDVSVKSGTLSVSAGTSVITAGTTVVTAGTLTSLPDIDIGDISKGTQTNDVIVTLDSEQVDVSDRAARDLGKVDIAGFDVSIPSGTNSIGSMDISAMPPVTGTVSGTISGSVTGTNIVQIIDENGVTIDWEGDSIVKAGVVIDVIHHEIHEGEDYEACQTFENVANNGTSTILVQVGSSKILHAAMEVAVGGDTFAYVYEGVTVDGTKIGTEITARNMNREDGADTAEGTFSYNGTFADNGIQLCNVLIPGGQKKNLSGGEGGGRHERMLALDTNYGIEIVNKSNATAHQSININFYEHS